MVMTMTMMMTWSRRTSDDRKCPRVSLVTVFCLIVCLFASVVVSEDKPTPPPNPKKPIEIVHKIENGNAILSCIVKDLGRRRVIWSRLADPFPISVGTMRFHPNSKYRVQNKANTNILTIRRVSITDAGEYQCKVGSGEFALRETLSLNIKSGPETTHFLATNRSITSAVGLSAILPCEVENLNDRMVMWKDSCNNVLTLRKRVYSGDKRLSIIHGRRREWQLKIDQLKEEDFGHYTCVVNSDPILTRTVHLINEEPPKFAPVIMKDTNFRTKVEVMAGETVTLTCNFNSYPPATVYWYKRVKIDGKNKKQDLGAVGNEYTLKSVRLEQAGDYVCIGKNGMNEEGKARTRLAVKAPPTTVPTTVATTTILPNGPTAPHLYYEEKRTGQRRGRDIEITCFAIGQPRPAIHWKRHSRRLMNDHKYRVTSVSRGRHTKHSTLLIRSVSSRDYGTYECIGYNQLGLVNTSLELYELKI